MISKQFFTGVTFILSAFVISSCGTTTVEPTTVGLANPASVYCAEQGYLHEIRTEADGGQYGVCIFPGGSECEEWAFYRGECGPGGVVEQPTEVPTVVPTEPATEQASEIPTETPIAPPTPAGPAEKWVYVDLEPDETGTTLTWFDTLSGAASSVPAPGTRYQLIGDWAYYQESSGGTVHRVNEASQDERFDFMGIPEGNFETVDWAISADGTQIVWNLFTFEAEQSGEVTLTSDIYIGDIASGETRLLTTYVTHEHQILIPWGFSPDGSQVFVYLQPYGIGGLFGVYGAFSALDVASGQLTPLHEPATHSIYGGPAAISTDGTRLARFLYLEEQGFKVFLTDLASGQTTEIATVSAEPGNNSLGDPVFSPDGSTLIYTMAYGDWGSEGYALFQLDTATATQQEILPPQPDYHKVVRFEDDGSLLLRIIWSGEETGTFRLHPDGTLERLSEATLVGIAQ
jgi:putative hemolysin